jgi:hypothetical protein
MLAMLERFGFLILIVVIKLGVLNAIIEPIDNFIVFLLRL